MVRALLSDRPMFGSSLWTKLSIATLAALAFTNSCTSREKTTPSVDQAARAISPVTVSFQNGSLPTVGYAGTTDTTLRQSAATTNAGDATECFVDGSDMGGDVSCLIRWSVIGIPIGSVVQSASITLNAVDATADTYVFYEMFRPWNEMEATWNNATTAVPWATPGARGGTDRGSGGLGGITGGGELTVELNSRGVAVVQSWVDGVPTSGIVISHETSGDGVDIASSEHETVYMRPKLTITYVPPGALRTVSYRNGSLPTTAYSGMEDATLLEASPTANASTQDICVLDGDLGNDLSCVMRWSALDIPSGSVIQSASLSLTTVQATAQTYEIYPLRRAWSESGVTWNHASGSVAWTIPGAMDETDRDYEPIGTVTGAGSLDVPLDADGVSLIQSWVDGTLSNDGMIISDTRNTDGAQIASSEHATVANRPMLTVTYLPSLIAAGSTWKYLDDGSDQGTSWRNEPFDDSAWKLGAAELGYGDADEATTIASGPSGNYHITHYFRRTFGVEAPHLIGGLTLSIRRDDGAVVYLNGTEILRDNLPSGAVTSVTPASSASEGDSWIQVSVSPSLLLFGANVLAAEVHQVDGSSDDVSFNLELRATALDYGEATVNYTAMAPTAPVLNPERGWYARVDLDHDYSTYPRFRDEGRTLALATVNLEDFLSGSISSTFLQSLEDGLNDARANGIKVILRFKYHDQDGTDPSIMQIQDHIDQVTQLMQNHADVIAVYQAGWIGDWGEMHDSPHIDTDDNSGDWPEIMVPFFDAVPDHRAIQFRRPDFKTAYLSSQMISNHDPVTSAEAFGTSIKARAGHYNDCFLCSASDSGTYDNSPMTIADWKLYVRAEAQYVPAGGETGGGDETAVDSGTHAYLRGEDACNISVAELAWLRYSFMSGGWHEWMTNDCNATTEAECDNPNLPCKCTWDKWNCKEEIGAKLGYRFVLQQATYSGAVRPDHNLELNIDFENNGFAAMYNKRRVYVVLERNTTTFYARLDTMADADPRRWLPGTHNLSRSLKIPWYAAPGVYTMSLWLPDDAEGLQSRHEYAVRFANTGIWDETPGFNVLGTVLISSSAPSNTGSYDVEFTSSP